MNNTSQTLSIPDAPGLEEGQPAAAASPSRERLLAYLVLGIFFGIVLIKAEVVSWFRIQEMFRFQSFHMFGILGSAVVVAGVSIALIKRFGARTVDGEEIRIPPKVMGPGAYRYWIGGLTFGFGWALLGACPAPIFALFGHGVTVMAVALLSALAGTWAYAALRHKLPH